MVFIGPAMPVLIAAVLILLVGRGTVLMGSAAGVLTAVVVLTAAKVLTAAVID